MGSTPAPGHHALPIPLPSTPAPSQIMGIKNIIQALSNKLARKPGKVKMSKEEKYAMKMNRLLHKYNEVGAENTLPQKGTLRNLRRTLERTRNSIKRQGKIVN